MLWAGLWWGGAKCLLSVCPPWMGWEESGQEGSVGEGMFPCHGERGDGWGESSAVIHPWKDAYYEVWALVPLPRLRVLGGAHWDVTVHLWSFRLCVFIKGENQKCQSSHLQTCHKSHRDFTAKCRDCGSWLGMPETLWNSWI